MAQNPWQQRIARAEELAAKHPFAAEVLRFFVPVARFQAEMYKNLTSAAIRREELAFSRPIWPGLASGFHSFLSIVENNAPAPLLEAAREMRGLSEDARTAFLNTFWNGNGASVESSGPHDFFPHAFLQPYAAFVRSQSEVNASRHTPCLCPFCNRKPVAGVLRPMGDGGQRSLVCSLCLAEWEFRRIVCPGCGEEDPATLPVYTAEEFNYLRVEGCDSCKTYIKTVDMTKNGLADPIVDELASIPLDLWAQQQGYSKLQPNLMQL